MPSMAPNTVAQPSAIGVTTISTVVPGAMLGEQFPDSLSRSLESEQLAGAPPVFCSVILKVLFF